VDIIRVMSEFQFIDEDASLHEMLAFLEKCPRFSVDLESDSFHHYAERIALVQIAAGGRVFIVDPLRVEIMPLAPLFADVSREKVFHDADYDGRMILTSLGVRPDPVFDTMIAARVLGKQRVGLADLLEEYFGLSVDKGFQKADWSRRPLEADMLAYAAMDVAHLLPLRERMEEEMEKLGRLAWAREEFDRLVRELEPMPEKKTNLFRVKGARNLSPRQLAVLEELLEWREGVARRMDLPPFKVVGTERLLKLAEALPRNRRELETCGALSHRQASRFGEEMVRAVQRGLGRARSTLPQFPAPARVPRDLEAEKLLRKFKEVRDIRAAELGMDPGFLLPNASLKGLARLRPRGLEDIRKSGLLKGWQLEAMGEALAERLPSGHA
jgi:ribonuclease D